MKNGVAFSTIESYTNQPPSFEGLPGINTHITSNDYTSILDKKSDKIKKNCKPKYT